MSVQDAAIAVPKYDLDKIVGTTLLVNPSIGASFGGITEDCLPIGIVSSDGGTTWHDCGNYSLPSGITLEPATWARLLCDTAGKMNLDVHGGTTYRVKVAWLAKQVQGGVSELEVTGDKLLYSNKYSYMKIAKQGSFGVNTGALATTTIAHNLGYVPFFMVFIKDATYAAYTAIRPINADFGNAGSISEGARVDATNLYISTQHTIPAQDITVYYRIYYET